MARSWQNPQVIVATLLFCFAIFNKVTSASKVTAICIFYHNYLYTRICNFTGKNYQERAELYRYKDGEGPHLTIALQLGLVTLSQTQATLPSMSQYCYKVHVYKVFSDRLYKQCRSGPRPPVALTLGVNSHPSVLSGNKPGSLGAVSFV